MDCMKTILIAVWNFLVSIGEARAKWAKSPYSRGY